MGNQMVMYDEELQQIHRVCDTLQRDANAKAILVIDKNGQPISQSG
jgi:predicted regulator of Ras-like GTPase activity (Roadblock/LC7/MglB family)